MVPLVLRPLRVEEKLSEVTVCGAFRVVYQAPKSVVHIFITLVVIED